MKAPAFLLLASVVIRLPSLWEPRWYSDEGTFTTVAWVHSLGVPLYSGVFDVNPPGIYWLYGLLLRLGGDQHHLVIQGALLVAVLVSVLCIYRLAGQWFSESIATGAGLLTAVGLSIPTLDGDLLNVEVAALPFFLAALLLAVQKGAYWALAAGLFAAAALLIRPSYALDCATVLVALIFARQAFLRLALAAIGALLVVGSTAVALAVGGSLDPYVGIVSETQRAYLLWSNGDSLFPLILRIAVGAAIAVIWFWRAANRSCRLLAIWLPASAIGASLTPRELSHYAIEVIPPLSVAIAALTSAALKSLSAGRPWPRFASAIVATPVALIMLVGGAEVVLIAPAQEVALLRSTHAPPPFLHNFSYARLPAYYGRWLRWMTQHPFTTQGLTGFPGPIREEIAEARVLDQLADDSSTRVLVLGDRAVTYFLARRRPATRYVAQNSGFRLVPDASTEVGTSLDARRAEVVAIADAPPGDWRSRLEDDGYRLVASYPWQTYRSEP